MSSAMAKELLNGNLVVNQDGNCLQFYNLFFLFFVNFCNYEFL